MRGIIQMQGWFDILRIRSLSKSHEGSNDGAIVPSSNNLPQSYIVQEGKGAIAGLSGAGGMEVESDCVIGKIVPVLLFDVVLNSSASILKLNLISSWFNLRNNDIFLFPSESLSFVLRFRNEILSIS